MGSLKPVYTGNAFEAGNTPAQRAERRARTRRRAWRRIKLASTALWRWLNGRQPWGGL
jgi:hypothetical protein